MEFKNALAKIGSSVCIVSVVEDEFVHACTIGSLSASNIASPELMFVLTNTSNVGNKIKEKKCLSISVLNKDQVHDARYFANPRPLQNINTLLGRFDTIQLRNNNHVVVANAAAHFICEFTESTVRGTSEIYFVTVHTAHKTEIPGLLYQDREYS